MISVSRLSPKPVPAERRDKAELLGELLDSLTAASVYLTAIGPQLHEPMISREIADAFKMVAAQSERAIEAAKALREKLSREERKA